VTDEAYIEGGRHFGTLGDPAKQAKQSESAEEQRFLGVMTINE
jgi:hypothetical protein